MTGGQAFPLPFVIGHRGAAGLLPENTLPSMAKAFELGARAIEIDIHLTKDGETVLSHDPDIRRIAGDKTPIAEQDSAILRQVEWIEKGTRQRLAWLDETLALVKAAHGSINIEIKPHDGREQAVAAAVLRQVTAAKMMTSVLISSFSPKLLEEVRRQNTDIMLGYLDERFSLQALTRAQALDCRSIHLSRRYLEAGQVKQVKELGFTLLAYTVNRKRQAAQLKSWGVDGIFTDRPDKMLALELAESG